MLLWTRGFVDIIEEHSNTEQNEQKLTVSMIKQSYS